MTMIRSLDFLSAKWTSGYNLLLVRCTTCNSHFYQPSNKRLLWDEKCQKYHDLLREKTIIDDLVRRENEITEKGK